MASMLEQLRGRVAGVKRALRSAAGSVQDVRAAVGKLKAERTAVETAAVPIEEAIPVVDDVVSRLLAGLAHHLPLSDVLNAAAHGRSADVRMLASEQRVQLLLSALAPVLLTHFREGLTQHYRTIAAGLPAPERRKRLAEIDAELADLEREEEELIVEMAGAGVIIERRPDADPAAVLGL